MNEIKAQLLPIILILAKSCRYVYRICLMVYNKLNIGFFKFVAHWVWHQVLRSKAAMWTQVLLIEERIRSGRNSISSNKRDEWQHTPSTASFLWQSRWKWTAAIFLLTLHGRFRSDVCWNLWQLCTFLRLCRDRAADYKGTVGDVPPGLSLGRNEHAADNGVWLAEWVNA